jgi:hypothetical protein
LSNRNESAYLQTARDKSSTTIQNYQAVRIEISSETKSVINQLNQKNKFELESIIANAEIVILRANSELKISRVVHTQKNLIHALAAAIEMMRRTERAAQESINEYTPSQFADQSDGESEGEEKPVAKQSNKKAKRGESQI